MVVINWLDKFWHMIGRFLNALRHDFGSNVYPQGKGVHCEITQFQATGVWWTCQNPKNVPEDWSRINLTRVVRGPDCVNVVTEIVDPSAKVSWFMHE